MTRLSDDPPFRRLSRLMPAAPDEARSARIQARCHAALARQRRPPLGGNWRSLELALGGGLALVYVCLVVHEVLRASGVW